MEQNRDKIPVNDIITPQEGAFLGYTLEGDLKTDCGGDHYIPRGLYVGKLTLEQIREAREERRIITSPIIGAVLLGSEAFNGKIALGIRLAPIDNSGHTTKDPVFGRYDKEKEFIPDESGELLAKFKEMSEKDLFLRGENKKTTPEGESMSNESKR